MDKHIPIPEKFIRVAKEPKPVKMNPFKTMEIGESFAMPIGEDQWRCLWRSKRWQAKLRKSTGNPSIKFVWDDEMNDDGTPTGTARCWRIA